MTIIGFARTRAIQGAQALLQISGVALLVVLACFALTPDASADGAGSLKLKPFVVSIHADWCGTCRMLSPTWQAIETQLADRAVVVKLDVSDRVAVAHSTAEAERLGLSAFFREYRAVTGTIGVIDGRTYQTIAVMRGESDFSKYQEAVAKATP